MVCRDLCERGDAHVPADLRRCREYDLITIFLSAYEDKAWAHATLDWLDTQKDGAPECLATRSDGKTLVIEHTLIQPFPKDKEDFARSKRFQRIEADQSLIIPGRIIYVDIPAGALQTGASWDAVITIVHDWLHANIAAFPEGISQPLCPINGVQKARDLQLLVRVVCVPDPAGKLLIRRYGDIRLDEVIETALRNKLPKLVRTKADTRMLLLERDPFTLAPLRIYDAIEQRRARFPDLADVDEIWIVEAPGFTTDHQSAYFERYDRRVLVRTLTFLDGQLIGQSADGVPYPLNTACLWHEPMMVHGCTCGSHVRNGQSEETR